LTGAFGFILVAYSAQLKEFFISSTPWTTTASGRMLDSLHPRNRCWSFKNWVWKILRSSFS